MSNVKIIGTPLYQWEHGRKVQVFPLRDMRVDAVHFCNFGDSEALVVLPKEENGMIVADIPNILLQSGENIVIHSVNVSADSVETIMDCTLAVRSRAKPADYVYTETEVLTITTAVEKALQEAKESGEFDGKDGKDGEDGKDGKDGYTPEKGVDYYTEAEKKELIDDIEQQVTGNIEAALDSIIAIQNALIGGDGV